MADTVERIGPHEAREHMRSGALLICAYDSDEKFRQNRINEAISLAEFRAREASLRKDQEIIFYCA